MSTATTAAGGYYRFDNLPAGDYVVVIPADQFASGGPLAGHWSSGTSLAGGAVSEASAPDADDDMDRDDNGMRRTSGAFSGAVISRAVTLGPGASEPINDNDSVPHPDAGEAPDAQSNRTVDFGFYRMQRGDLVFVDVNSNGAYDAGDAPLPGATVQLYSADGVTEINTGADGILGTSDDAPGGVVTGAGGTYLFSGLPAGDYIVRVTPPAGYPSTVDNASPGDTPDPNSNTDNNDNGLGGSSETASSNVVTLTPGSAGTLNNNTVTQSTGTTAAPTLDFGFLAPTATPIPTQTLIGTPTLTPTAVVQIADPALAKSADPAQASVGETITFTLTVTNQGNIPAPNVVVTDVLSPNFDVTAVQVSGAPLGTRVSVTPPIGTATAPSTVVVTFVGTLNVTDVVDIEITTAVNSLGNPPLVNTARLSTSAPSDITANNTDSVAIPVREARQSERITLPATGFARDRVTPLGEQPVELTYVPTRLMLEIPGLNVNIPIGRGWGRKPDGWNAAPSPPGRAIAC